MRTDFLTSVRQHDWLICVDSDGCAIDTMDIKHIRCFGPCMVAEWGLKDWAKPILARWNEINLYTMTRGINRFKGLSIALAEIDKQYKKLMVSKNCFAGWTVVLPPATMQCVLHTKQPIAKSSKRHLIGLKL